MKKLFNWFKRTFKRLSKLVKKMVPIAVKATQAVKNVVDSKDYKKYKSIADILKKIIPGEIDDIIIDKIASIMENNIPKLALRFEIVDTIDESEDKQTQVMKVFERVSEGIETEKREKLLSTLTQTVAYDLTDNEGTWGEIGKWVEIYYEELYKD